jgi:AraC family transcriptional regulator
MGVTPLNYINQKRVEKGKYLLEHTQFSVGEISEEVGFKDELYFSRVFKKYVGISPLAYRKQVLTHIL